MTVGFLASRVRNRRLALGLSQEKLAEKAKVQLKTIQKIEQGLTKDPHLSTILNLTSALRVSPLYFTPPEKLEHLLPKERFISELDQLFHSERDLEVSRNLLKSISNYLDHKK